jgi:hypothetical protein
MSIFVEVFDVRNGLPGHIQVQLREGRWRDEEGVTKRFFSEKPFLRMRFLKLSNIEELIRELRQIHIKKTQNNRLRSRYSSDRNYRIV